MKGLMEVRQIDTQFGNRKGGKGCSDAVHILRIVVEKSNEWAEGLCVAAVDVQKAFDRVHHMRILQALVDEKVDADIVMSLQNMYSSLRGYVQLWAVAWRVQQRLRDRTKGKAR